VNMPPPLPVSPPPAPSPQAPPPRNGMSGCVIALIIGAVVGVFGIAIIGILAALAVPQYQEYVVRSKIMGAYATVQGLQPQVDAWREANQACPGNADVGQAEDATLPLGTSNDAKGQAHLTVGSLDGGDCAIELRLEGLGPAVDGKTLVAVSDKAGWRCDAGTLEERYLPLPCRRAGATSP
jgi:type IV pilus assembly protein PilA